LKMKKLTVSGFRNRCRQPSNAPCERNETVRGQQGRLPGLLCFVSGVPAGRNVPPKIHIPSLTGRVRDVGHIFSTNILSLTGHVETRCIASPCGGEWRYPAGSPGTMGTMGTVGTIPVTELAKNKCRYRQPPLRTARSCEERSKAGSNPATTGTFVWTALLRASQPLAVTGDARGLNPVTTVSPDCFVALARGA
jgi:hypothetical protein